MAGRFAVRFEVLVEVSPRAGIADPEGSTVERSLPALGYDSVSDVRIGKAIRFLIDATDESSARQTVGDMCDRFLTNPVIEDAAISLTIA